MIDLSGHFYVRLSEEEIQESGGDYLRAMINAYGFTGIEFTDVGDDDDNRVLPE